MYKIEFILEDIKENIDKKKSLELHFKIINEDKACKWTKSNSIVLCREYKPGCFQVMGMGAGQPNRVDSLRKLAVTKAEENLKRYYANGTFDEYEEDFLKREFANMVMASDAFFPCCFSYPSRCIASIRMA